MVREPSMQPDRLGRVAASIRSDTVLCWRREERLPTGRTRYFRPAGLWRSMVKGISTVRRRIAGRTARARCGSFRFELRDDSLHRAMLSLMNSSRCLGLIGGLGVGAAVHYYVKLAKAHHAVERTLDMVMVHAE